MASLIVRTVGMSIAIEGLATAGLDPAGLLNRLAAAHGEAVAGVGTPTEAVLIDRKVMAWPAVLETVAAWVRDEGHTAAATWHEAGGPHGRCARLDLRD